jgi:hypothetical protein
MRLPCLMCVYTCVTPNIFGISEIAEQAEGRTNET